MLGVWIAPVTAQLMMILGMAVPLADSEEGVCRRWGGRARGLVGWLVLGCQLAATLGNKLEFWKATVHGRHSRRLPIASASARSR